MMNSKFSIGVVIAIVLQVSAFVWWTAQQAQTISQLNVQVTELTSRMAVEDNVNMNRDIDDMKSSWSFSKNLFMFYCDVRSSLHIIYRENMQP